MTPSVRLSLKILRGYLILMSLMFDLHVLDLAGRPYERQVLTVGGG